MERFLKDIRYKWVLIAVIGLGIIVGIYNFTNGAFSEFTIESNEIDPNNGFGNISNQVEQKNEGQNQVIFRSIIFVTDIQDFKGYEVFQYQVQFGDSLFSIARNNNITPETLLWANDKALEGNPDFLEPGMELNIPPIDGVYFQWRAGDDFNAVADQFDALPSDIINWPGNHVADLSDPYLEPGTWIMIPGGVGEFQQWVIPIIPSGSAGVSASLYGSGSCPGRYGVGLGTGSFMWPSHIHTIVGNDYWLGHLAIDIATDFGLSIVASDSGVVVFSGWASGGYGSMVMIDHGNGYYTVYAHLQQATAVCGSNVFKGQKIGVGGSSGNSTGPHLHFEVRYLDGFVNPYSVLPPP